MRVLAVTLGYPKEPGDSTAPFVDAIVRGLARRGHEVDVVLPHHPEFRYPDGERVRFFPYRYSPLARLSPWGFGQTFDAKARVGAQVLPLLPAIALSLRRAIQRRLAAEDHDVVHAHWLLPNGWAAASVAGRAEVPVVVTLHGSDVAMAERHLPLRRMARQTFGRVAAVTATSDDLRRRALELGAEPRAATVTYIGVDAERFAPRPADRETRRLLGAEEGDLLVVAVGRLARVKGFEYVIEAASRLPRVALAIVGEGELRPELELLVRSSSARVLLTGGMPHNRIPHVLAAADVVVVPSVVDSRGRVDSTTSTVPEALASGRPLVATAVGGIPELVCDGENGLLVPQKDPAALAASIERLGGDADLRERLARRGREFAVQRLSWEATIDALEASFAEAIARPHGRVGPRRR
ncbi:MAG TPA: glycosyltransferase [Gaiellaceae bacterium]|nr:glycosyltransferase [Gaiellaceae bacterium]